ncbi:hypothetical protein HKCCE2091_06445 [Rhodobacterales bacterium HKCCE2091]|nr:hypothetical protein [Rhodobacterales bacterium HKCCE2091]
MDRNRENLIAGGAVLGISALLFSQALPGQFAGVELARNPMTFPRFLLVIFAAGGAVLLIQGLVGRRAAGSAGPGLAWRRVLAVLVLAGVYLAAFAPAGFIPATLVFLPAVIVTLGYRNPLVIAAVTLLTVAGLWYAFAELFSIRPPGIGIDDMIRAIGGGS